MKTTRKRYGVNTILPIWKRLGFKTKEEWLKAQQKETIESHGDEDGDKAGEV
jgi:hypothetical protein